LPHQGRPDAAFGCLRTVTRREERGCWALAPLHPVRPTDQHTPSATKARCSLAGGSPGKIDRRSRCRQGRHESERRTPFRVGRPSAAPPILEEFNFAPNPTDAFAAPFLVRGSHIRSFAKCAELWEPIQMGTAASITPPPACPKYATISEAAPAEEGPLDHAAPALWTARSVHFASLRSARVLTAFTRPLQSSSGTLGIRDGQHETHFKRRTADRTPAAPMAAPVSCCADRDRWFQCTTDGLCRSSVLIGPLPPVQDDGA
jgi:hypothetical protein